MSSLTTQIEPAPNSLEVAIAGTPSTAASPGPVIIGADNLKKTYRRGTTEVPVLQGVSMEVPTGSLCAIVGASGSGKSTLLHLLATLDQPDGGSISYAGQRIDNLSRRHRDRLRNQDFGMVFQFYHLLPELSALENVLLPSMIGRSIAAYFAGARKLKQRAQDLLATVQLSHRASHRPSELSGGEIQRVAIARALMSNPKVLFADEPTGNLDRKTGEGIMELLMSLNDESQLTIVMVTHDHRIAGRAPLTMALADGRLQRHVQRE